MPIVAPSAAAVVTAGRGTTLGAIVVLLAGSATMALWTASGVIAERILILMAEIAAVAARIVRLDQGVDLFLKNRQAVEDLFDVALVFFEKTHVLLLLFLVFSVPWRGCTAGPPNAGHGLFDFRGFLSHWVSFGEPHRPDE